MSKRLKITAVSVDDFKWIEDKMNVLLPNLVIEQGGVVNKKLGNVLHIDLETPPLNHEVYLPKGIIGITIENDKMVINMQSDFVFTIPINKNPTLKLTTIT